VSQFDLVIFFLTHTTACGKLLKIHMAVPEGGGGDMTHRPIVSEVDAYQFIRVDLGRIGWVPKNPTRTKDGQVYTQGECLAEPRIKEQLGQTKPENIVKISETDFYVIEGKSERSQINQAVKEAEEDYAVKINKSKHISVKIISGVAGNDIDGYLVKSKFLVGGKFQTIVSNGKELTGLVTPAIARHLLTHNSNVIEDLPIEEKQFFQAADKINKILHNGAIPATERGKVISALILSLVDDTHPNVNASPTVLIDEINARVNAVLQRKGKPEFYNYIRIVPPTTQANHKKFKDALVKTIQELTNLNIRSAMNSGTDILGEFYEVFLKYGSWAKEIGIVLTPRHITRFAARILDVTAKDIVYDPTCGTGGFLVSALDYAKRKAKARDLDTFKKNSIFGVEQEPSIVALAVVNMIFRDDGKNNIKEANCFHEWLHLVRRGDSNVAEWVDRNSVRRVPPVTKVLMNPPFALKEKDEQEHKFVNQALAQMQEGGLLFAILPYSELIQDGDALLWRRQELLAQNTLVAVVSFPEDLFYPVAGKHTCGIVIKRGVPHDYTQDVLWIQILDDGYIKRKKKRISKNTVDNDLTKSVELISAFIHDGVIPASVPRFIKASPISDQDTDLELVPGVNLENRDYALADLKTRMQEQLRGLLSFAVRNGCFPYELFSSPPKVDPQRASSIRWVNLRIKDLFDMENGYTASIFQLLKNQREGCVPLFRPTSDMHHLIAGWIESKEHSEKVHKAGSLMVSTDGEGSHTYAYVTPIDFIPNSNTAVLKPKSPMPLSFQLFVSIAITNERWRYSYGRKPKGDRLKNLLLKVPALKDGTPDVQAFETMAMSIPEFGYVLPYFKALH
jgi:type I restriction enzyme M protein